MRAFVTDASGTVWELPPAGDWEMAFGTGTPCDSFVYRCPWAMGLGMEPENWVGFHAEHDGRRVFTGVVDECEISLTGRGCELELSGRGMAALLLDNEALGQDYQLATLEDILRDHVAPYGIETVCTAALPHAARFRVETGSSEWTALESFLRAVGGGAPRFDSRGRLILGGWEEDGCLRIGGELPVTRLCRRDKRCGVLSEILVRDRYSGAVQTVSNEAFVRRGGRARRVLTMPGHASPGQMQRRGSEQLERSARESLEIEVTVPAPFWAMPGQRVNIERYNCDFNGMYRTAKSETGGDASGYWTRLTLRPVDRV